VVVAGVFAFALRLVAGRGWVLASGAFCLGWLSALAGNELIYGEDGHDYLLAVLPSIGFVVGCTLVFLALLAHFPRLKNT
jgi:hypothetical protein